MAIRLQIEQGLATITVDCPATMNVIGLTELRELNTVTCRIADDPEVRVVLIRAEGAVFGAGGDLSCFQCGERDSPQTLQEIGHEVKAIILRVRNLRAIVIASVQGAVIGGSMTLMNAADLVIAAKGTRFNMGYARIGASPDGGSSWFMPRLVGARKTLEWMLLSDNFDADTALSFGLVNQVVPAEQLRDVCDKLAARLVRGPQESFARMKRLVYQATEQTLAQQLDAEIEQLAAVVKTPDFAEGISAFFGKRVPHFNLK